MSLIKSPSPILVNSFNELEAKNFRNSVREHLEENPGHPLVINIDSYGGQIDALASMLDTLDSMTDTPVITYCSGKAMSCGAILLSCGNIRFCGPNSRIMIHEVSGGSIGSVGDLKNVSSEMDKMNKRFLGLLAKNCKLKGGYRELKKILEKNTSPDLYLNASAALKFGIIDHIGQPKIQLYYNYEIVNEYNPKTK